jgi:hypothetical protein
LTIEKMAGLRFIRVRPRLIPTGSGSKTDARPTRVAIVTLGFGEVAWLAAGIARDDNDVSDVRCFVDTFVSK